MPIIGLFLCICRCAGQCGGKRHYDNAPKHDRCRRATCGLLLLVLATLITYVFHFLPARRYASAGNSDRNVSIRLSVRHAPLLCQNEES